MRILNLFRMTLFHSMKSTTERKKSVLFSRLVTKMVTFSAYRLVPLEQSFGKIEVFYIFHFRQCDFMKQLVKEKNF
jgi:hypothetical protein